MKSEYIRFTKQETILGKKQTLNTKLAMLSQIKSFNRYLELRSEELSLKIALKTKIEETFQTINLLQKILPKTEFKISSHAEKVQNTPVKKKVLTLEQEIQDLQKQIAQLQ